MRCLGALLDDAQVEADALTWCSLKKDEAHVEADALTWCSLKYGLIMMRLALWLC